MLFNLKCCMILFHSFCRYFSDIIEKCVYLKNAVQTQAAMKRMRKKNFTLDATLHAKCIYISLLLPANIISQYKKYNFNIFMYWRWFPISGYDFSMNKLCYLCHFHNMEILYLLSNHNLVTKTIFSFLWGWFFFWLIWMLKAITKLNRFIFSDWLFLKMFGYDQRMRS